MTARPVGDHYFGRGGSVELPRRGLQSHRCQDASLADVRDPDPPRSAPSAAPNCYRPSPIRRCGRSELRSRLGGCSSRSWPPPSWGNDHDKHQAAVCRLPDDPRRYCGNRHRRVRHVSRGSGKWSSRTAPSFRAIFFSLELGPLQEGVSRNEGYVPRLGVASQLAGGRSRGGGTPDPW